MIYYAFKAPLNNNAHVDTTAIKQLIRQVALVNNYRKDNTEENNIVTIDIDEYELNNYINHSLEYTLNELGLKTNRIYIIGSGNTIINQYPKSNPNMLSNQPIFLLTNYENILMIDYLGMNKKDLVAYFEFIGVDYIFTGEGIAVSSNIEVGELINIDEVIEVNFE